MSLESAHHSITSLDRLRKIVRARGYGKMDHPDAWQIKGEGWL
jgi:hypothetical protein